jgi:hypothetical protein
MREGAALLDRSVAAADALRTVDGDERPACPQRSATMYSPFLPVGLVAGLLAAGLPAQPAPGSDAPEIAFTDSLNFGRVKARKLSDLRGSAVLIEFWATW